MGQYTVTLSDEEEKALLTNMASVQAWIDNAVHNKARQCLDKIVEEYSDKQPSKIPEAEKLLIVREADVLTAVEKAAELEEK